MSERRSELKAVPAPEDSGAKNAKLDFLNLTQNVVEGWTELGGRLVSLAQSSLRNGLSAAEQLRQCQTPQELVEVQAKLAREAYDDYLDESRKITEWVVKLSTNTIGSIGLPR